MNYTYCIRCRMHASLCLCADIHPITTRTQVAIIMHETEQWRTSNTGYLATLMLPNSVLRIHGERGRMLDVHDWFEPTHRAFVLFPDAHARVLDARLAEEDDRPIRLIVPDGTWRQARRMVRRVAGLAKVPRVTLPEGLVSDVPPAQEAVAQGACVPSKRSAKPCACWRGGTSTRHLFTCSTVSSSAYSGTGGCSPPNKLRAASQRAPFSFAEISAAASRLNFVL